MFQLTRYLYELSEVKGSLILALLKKDNDEALFWAFEYYHSKLPYDITNFIIQIYYDFYYTLNPTFEKYMFVKLKKVTIENEENELTLFIKLIIDNLIQRPHTLDVFLLRHTGLQYDADIQDNNPSDEIISSIMDPQEYLYISTILMKHSHYNDVANLKTLLSMVLDEMGKTQKINKNVKMKETVALLDKCYKDEYILKRTIVLAKMVNYLALHKGIKMHRSIYIENDENKQLHHLYEMTTKYPIDFKVNAKYATNQEYMGIFNLERFHTDYKNNYLNHWQYYAYKVPYWETVFDLYGGEVEDETYRIIFREDENKEEFYEDFDCYPDEETIEVQNRFIGKIEKGCNLKSFYIQFGTRNVIQDLEEDIQDLDLLQI